MALVKVRNKGNRTILVAGYYLTPGETREVNLAFYNQVPDDQKGDLEIVEGDPAPIPVVDPVAGPQPAAGRVARAGATTTADLGGGALAPGSVTDPGLQAYLAAEEAKAAAAQAKDQVPQPNPDPAPEYQPEVQAAQEELATAREAAPESEGDGEGEGEQPASTDSKRRTTKKADK